MRRRVALAMAVLTALVLAPVASVRADLPVPVVLIPGWHGDPASFDHMIPVLQRAGLSVLDFDPARPGPQAMAYAPTADGQHIPDVATRVVRPAIEAALARAGYPAGSAVDVVGYSMGGLVARYLIEKAGPTVGPVQLPGSSPRIDVRIDVTEKDPWARQVVATAATAATSSGSR